MGRLILIAAVAENNALGKDNDLIWHLPDDFKRFKKLTTGHRMIMGRKTFESFPGPLPNREHIVISRNPQYKIDHPACSVVPSLEAALNMIEEKEVAYVIGGGEIYALSMDYVDELEITRVHGNFEGDAFFPDFDKSRWRLVKEEYHPIDDRHAYAFTYETYTRA